MISRVAENLFWLGRYLERAESTARVCLVTRNLALDGDALLLGTHQGLFRQELGAPSTAPQYNAADLNCNGAVNAQDTTLFRSLLGSPPGPSALL